MEWVRNFSRFFSNHTHIHTHTHTSQIPEEGRLVIRVTEDISGDVGVVCYNGESKASQIPMLTVISVTCNTMLDVQFKMHFIYIYLDNKIDEFLAKLKFNSK